MKETEIDFPKERGLRLYKTNEAALKMVYQRFVLEDAGLRLIHLPLCQEDEAVTIEDYIPRAKTGFALSLKASSMTVSEMADLLEPSTPLSVQGIWQDIKIKERHNTLPEWFGFLATMAYLTNIGKVTYFGFEDLPGQMSARIGEAQTFWWDDQFTPGKIWTKMEELEHLTREALYSTESMGDRKLLILGHFYSAGREVSKIFLDL